MSGRARAGAISIQLNAHSYAEWDGSSVFTIAFRQLAKASKNFHIYGVDWPVNAFETFIFF